MRPIDMNIDQSIQRAHAAFLVQDNLRKKCRMVQREISTTQCSCRGERFSLLSISEKFQKQNRSKERVDQLNMGDFHPWTAG